MSYASTWNISRWQIVMIGLVNRRFSFAFDTEPTWKTMSSRHGCLLARVSSRVFAADTCTYFLRPSKGRYLGNKNSFLFELLYRWRVKRCTIEEGMNSHCYKTFRSPFGSFPVRLYSNHLLLWVDNGNPRRRNPCPGFRKPGRRTFVRWASCPSHFSIFFAKKMMVLAKATIFAILFIVTTISAEPVRDIRK